MTQVRPLRPDDPASATALLARAVRLNGDTLCAAINARLADDAMEFVVMATAQKSTIILSTARCHIVLRKGKGRLPRPAISGALASPAAKARAHPYDRAYDTHRAHLNLSVDHGPGPDADTDTGDGAPLTLATRLIVLRAALEALCAQHAVTLAHWHQSNMVFVPSEITGALGQTLPINMIAHPLPVPATAASDGTARIGLVALNTDQILGQTLCIDPLPRSAQALTDLAHVILYQHDAGHIDLDHGDSLSLRDGSVLHVRHDAPSLEWPAGRICVGETPPRARPAPTPRPTAASGTSTPRTGTEFQDRINRLRAQTALAQDLPDTPDTPPAATTMRAPLGIAVVLLMPLLAVAGYLAFEIQPVATELSSAEIIAPPAQK